MSPGHLLWVLFGPSTWGAGGNMVAWVICGVFGFGWLHARQKALHVARMAQATWHHSEVLAQATAQHDALVHQAARHQAELLDRADVHHEALKAHIVKEVKGG